MTRGVRRALWASLAGALLASFAYAFREPILAHIGLSLINEDRLQHSDAIVVLSGGAPIREIEAAGYAKGLVPKVVITTSPEQEGDAMLRRRDVRVESQFEFGKRVLSSLGVPESALVVCRLRLQDPHSTKPRWCGNGWRRTRLAASSS